MRSPFSLYTKKLKSGLFWYVRFYDSTTGKYSITRSTGIPCSGKKGRKIEAHKVAEEILIKMQDEQSPYLLLYLEEFWTVNSKYARQKKLTERELKIKQLVADNTIRRVLFVL